MAKDPAKGGVGYPDIFRERALSFLDVAPGETKQEQVQNVADIFGCSASSIYRWAARLASTGSLANEEHKGGVARRLDGAGDVILMLYMGARLLLCRACVVCLCVCVCVCLCVLVCACSCIPQRPPPELCCVAVGGDGPAISEDMVADAMERLSITRKHIRKIAVEQDLFGVFCPCAFACTVC